MDWLGEWGDKGELDRKQCGKRWGKADSKINFYKTYIVATEAPHYTLQSDSP